MSVAEKLVVGHRHSQPPSRSRLLRELQHTITTAHHYNSRDLGLHYENENVKHVVVVVVVVVVGAAKSPRDFNGFVRGRVHPPLYLRRTMVRNPLKVIMES
ncbi:hypothetical protein F5Y17DRAFT_462571 [Xylariaceae sp. FL0594]|nr:hypothetical protein F5Y17DRAFT_462571 [Xylariaceae sp. FL0594]